MEYKKLTINKQNINTEYNEYKILKDLYEKLDIYLSELAKLDLEKENIELYKNKMTRHELATSFKTIIDEIKGIKENITVNQNKL